MDKMQQKQEGMPTQSGERVSSSSPPEQLLSKSEFDSVLELFTKALEVISPNMRKRDDLERRGLWGLGDTILYHYTTSEGIQGIIEKGCFHSTAASFLNDASEISYGCDMFVEVLDEWCQVNEGRGTLASGVLLDARRSFSERITMQNTLAQIYVVCFCEQANLLSQWRAYGQSGGYSIGFDKFALEKFKTVGNLCAIRLERVIYDPSRQKEILHHIILDSVAELGRNDLEASYSEYNPKLRTALRQLLVHVLQIFALREIVRFKHPAFSEENEWRLIAQPPQHIDEKYEDLIKALKFKSSRGIPTPYIELKPEDNLLPIKSVRYGPTLDRKRVEHALGALFQKHGYPEVSLLGSDIPVRL